MYFELIDTLWNVNKAAVKFRLSDLHELIDTLWNVNVYAAKAAGTSVIELIDTLWNVNFGLMSYMKNANTN